MNCPHLPVSANFTRLALLIAFSFAGSFPVLAFQAGNDSRPEELPGTIPLTFEGNLSYHLLEQAHSFADRKILEAQNTRSRYWKRDFSSRQNYERSVEENKARFEGVFQFLHKHLNWP